MAGHAKLSPSSAARWLTCTASVALEDGIPEQASVYAAEGTLAHELCEIQASYQIGQIETAEYEKKYNAAIRDNELYNAEMQECVEGYAEYIKEEYFAAKEIDPTASCDFEVRLDLSKYVTESFGTSDCVIIAGDTLHVIDFKYGKGVQVEAEDNAQMKLYALGAYELYSMIFDIRNVKMTICQPRIGGLSSAQLVIEDLLEWAENTVAKKVKTINAGEGEYKPSKKACRFCKAKDRCEVRANYFISLFDENPEPGILTLEKVGELLLKAEDIKNWLSDLESRAEGALFNGKEVPGWKLVEGKSNRKYVDEAKVAKALKKHGLKPSEIYTKKLITITAVEKLLGKSVANDVIGDLLIKPKGKPTLAKESDKREAYNFLDQFDEEE